MFSQEWVKNTNDYYLWQRNIFPEKIMFRFLFLFFFFYIFLIWFEKKVYIIISVLLHFLKLILYKSSIFFLYLDIFFCAHRQLNSRFKFKKVSWNLECSLYLDTKKWILTMIKFKVVGYFSDQCFYTFIFLWFIF